MIEGLKESRKEELSDYLDNIENKRSGLIKGNIFLSLKLSTSLI